LTQDIGVPFETLGLERKEQGNMRGEHGLDFLLIPAGVSSLPIRPLLNAPLYLSIEGSSYSAPRKYVIGESCHYHCEYESDDWNRHWGESLMMANSHVILVTEQRHIKSLLDDRVSVWIMTFPTLTGLLLGRGQCPMSRGTEKAVPNEMDEIHISQQHLSKLDVRTYAFRRFARVEMIQVFHKTRKFWFHLSA
jgi:hypothetical protein